LCGEGDHIWVRGHFRHVVAYLKDFLFTAEQAKSPVGCLSGGEKNRLLLALSLARPSNFLVLDEPTNDLDMDTLDLLQEVLDEYEGTILLVSHDRDFLNKITTSMLYLKGDGTVLEHIGTYEELYQKYIANTPKEKTIPKPKEEKVVKPQNKPLRLSYKDQRLYEVLPQEIEKLEKQISETEQTLSNPDLYTSNPDKFYTLTETLASLKQQKDDKETQWLEISMLKESLA
jgi:ATP-binding cassette subfamily F protein uup